MRIEPDILQRCWFLTGPTASGKTEVSLRLARKLNAEIVALDSMSLYRGMDIGTAKATESERARVPHHLIDIINPDDEFTVAAYVERAAEVCEQVLCRGRTPLFVGGTGLYLRGLLRGVFEGPPADWAYRREMAAEAEKHEPNWLHQQLQSIDPETAGQRHPNDHRRLIRALEVYRVTGQPMSRLMIQKPLPENERPSHAYWLLPDRDWLYARINARVDAMIAAGLVDEVRGLLASEHPPARTARQALGYAEVIGYLEGHGTLDQAVERIKTRTRQFAKRQHTWFRKMVECTEISLPPTIRADDIVDRLTTS